MSSFWNFWRHYRVLSTTIPVGTMCKAKLQVAGILAMLLYHMFFIIVILPSSISRSRTRLSLWIDERQIASFFGKSILCICKNDNLSQFFFHIYVKNNDHRRKRCNMYISCSDLKKNKNVICFHDQEDNYPLLSISPFPDETDSTGCLTEEHVSFNDIATTFPNTTYSSMLQGEKKTPKNRVSRKKKLWAFFDYFTLAVPIVSKALRKCFPPSPN